MCKQVGQVLLTLPNSFAATGMAVGIFMQLLFATLALWTLYLLASLYQEFRKQRQAWRRDLHHGIIMVTVALHLSMAPGPAFFELCTTPQHCTRTLIMASSG